MSIEFRPAESEESQRLTSIIQETSGGLVDYILTGVIPFTKPHLILRSQVITEDSLYSYRNMVVCEEEGEIIGLILAYPWDEQVASDLTRRYLSEQKYGVVEDLLNSAEENSLFINTFWVSEKYRGEGLADVLMDVAAEWARSKGLTRLSLHVWKGNERAVRFYSRHGFIQTRTFPFPDHKLLHYKTGKLQMCKELA
ncbi:MAG: GNAT family N-acetyltransferase [Desulfovibrionaceae bacterium]|nr:GNAT family N-acetyltransferase [Desulfovibrionaceae bacterium]